MSSVSPIFRKIPVTYGEMIEVLTELGYHSELDGKNNRYINEEYSSTVIMPISPSDKFMDKIDVVTYSYRLFNQGVINDEESLVEMIQKNRLIKIALCYAYANIEIINATDKELLRRGSIDKSALRTIKVKVLANRSSVLLGINKDIQKVLGLPFRYKKLSKTEDGRTIELDVVGPVIVRFLDRESTTNAVILPDGKEPLLGTIPMDEMDLYVHPNRNELLPIHPDGPIMSLK